MPSLSSLRRRLGHHWPLALLLASIGLTALAAFDAQRVLRTRRQLAARALADYAGFAAWSYGQHLQASIDSMARDVLGAVDRGAQVHLDPHIPPAAELPHYLPWDAACRCHRTHVGPSPDVFVALDLRTRAASVDRNTLVRSFATDDRYRARTEPLAGAPGGGRGAGAILAAGESVPDSLRWLSESLERQIRSVPSFGGGFGLLIETPRPATRALAFTIMPTAWGDTIVYAAVYSEAALRNVLASVVDDRALLPSAFTEGRRNRQLLAVTVFDRTGQTLFASDSTVRLRYAARVRLPSRDDSLEVEAAIRPEIAGTLLVGGLPSSRLPFLFALLGLAAALSIVAAAQLRREGELSRRRSEFVSSVSHQLRTPVAQIRLYVETLMLGRVQSAEERAWALSNIERETTRLGSLVENVLRFSSLDVAAVGTPAATDVTAVVRQLVAEFAPLAAARKARLAFQSDAVSVVDAPADAVRHIVLNLLDNAVEYGPPGQSVRVDIESRGGAVSIAVEDEGPGVIESERESIWRAFVRGRAAAGKGGTGIGLTIVRRLARAHGGDATVESGACGGARFVVTLPLAAAHVHEHSP